MNRTARYVSALFVAGAITGVVSLLDPRPEAVIGIFGIWVLTTEILIRYPELVWGHDIGGHPSGVFGGGATFGGFMLAEYDPAAGLLGLSIAMFGLSTGYWVADSQHAVEITE